MYKFYKPPERVYKSADGMADLLNDVSLEAAAPGANAVFASSTPPRRHGPLHNSASDDQTFNSRATRATSRSALAIRSILQRHTASDAIDASPHGHCLGDQTDGRVIELDSDMTPWEAANVLWNGNILGGPVWNKSEMRYIGFFDMRDILSVVTASARRMQREKHRPPEQQNSRNEGADPIVKQQRYERRSSGSSTGSGSEIAGIYLTNNINGHGAGESSSTSSNKNTRPRPSYSAVHQRQFQYIMVSTLEEEVDWGDARRTRQHSLDGQEDDEAKPKRVHHYGGKYVPEIKPKTKPNPRHTIAQFATRNRFHACKFHTTLADLGRVLSLLRCHRMPVVDDRRCRAIISQSGLIQFIHQHFVMGDANVDDLDETLPEAGLAYEKCVVTVPEDATAYEAFESLVSHRISGVAVVDDEGKMVGNTSARDIKLAALDEGKTTMDMDIISYLAAVRQAEQGVKNEVYPSCHVYAKSATVGKVLSILAKTGYHRVFVVDEDRRPVGVVSVTDIIDFAVGTRTIVQQQRHRMRHTPYRPQHQRVSELLPFSHESPPHRLSDSVLGGSDNHSSGDEDEENNKFSDCGG